MIVVEEIIVEILYRKDVVGNVVVEVIGLEIFLDENEKDFIYDVVIVIFIWKGILEGIVYIYDVNLNIIYIYNWGVVIKIFKVIVIRKVQ